MRFAGYQIGFIIFGNLVLFSKLNLTNPRRNGQKNKTSIYQIWCSVILNFENFSVHDADYAFVSFFLRNILGVHHNKVQTWGPIYSHLQKDMVSMLKPADSFFDGCLIDFHFLNPSLLKTNKSLIKKIEFSIFSCMHI